MGYDDDGTVRHSVVDRVSGERETREQRMRERALGGWLLSEKVLSFSLQLSSVVVWSRGI